MTSASVRFIMLEVISVFGMVNLLFIEFQCVLNDIEKGINIFVGSCLYVCALENSKTE